MTPPSVTREELEHALRHTCDNAERWIASRMWEKRDEDAMQCVRDAIPRTLAALGHALPDDTAQEGR